MTDPLHARLLEDRVLYDLADHATITLLRAEVERIAAAMSAGGGAPPMLWTGIPLPSLENASRRDTRDYCLLVSVGGTHTDFAIMRRVDDVVYCIAPGGKEVRWSSNSEVRRRYRMATPNDTDTETGFAMIEAIVAQVVRHFGEPRELLESCRNVILSWGYGHDVYLKAPGVVGAIEARSAGMTKGQVRFEADLLGRDIGRLFELAFERQLGWSRPVTVANDGVMAMHYFLTAEHLERYAQLGLAIIGTGTNFAIAEPYATRPEGPISAEGEKYQPRRICAAEQPQPNEGVVKYFVNYETCEMELRATRAPFDRGGPNSIEEEAIAGGQAFWHQFQGMVPRYLGEGVYDELLAAWRRPGGRPPAITGVVVSTLGTSSEEEFVSCLESSFPGVHLSSEEQATLRSICAAAVTRSALHMALVLAAVTKRLGFGLGSGERKDLLGLEGSVWRTASYQEQVRELWSALVEQPLQVDFAHEPQFNASLPGALALLRLHE